MEAQVPVTCGAAMEVPEKTPKMFPGTEELMDSPGATSDKKDAELEKLAIASDLLVAPTLIADEIHAGTAILFGEL